MVDPVTLSGGPLGGEVVEGVGWLEGDVKTFDSRQYRRQGSQAVYIGDA